MKLNFLERYFSKRAIAKLEKQSKVSGAIVTGIPGGVVWPIRDYENFAKETYMKNYIAYRCIDYIAKSVSSVKWKLYKNINETEREVVQDHFLNKILSRANPRESFICLVYNHISYLCMSGNAFLEKVGPTEGTNKGEIKELYALRPDRMKINTDENSGEILGYTYSVNGRDIKFEVDPMTGDCEILHMKLFNPLDDFYGMAPTEPAAISIDSHNSSSMWNKRLLENEARPGAVFMFEKTLQDKQYDRLRRQIEEHREGPENAGKSLIIEGGKDVKPYGFSPTEMDWIQSNLELARATCIVWGVPPQLIGIPDTSTYANFQEARLAFWEETNFFYLNFLKDEFNYWFFPNNKEKLFLDYILDDVPALAIKRDKLWARAQSSSFISENEKREMVGYEKTEYGDVILVPASMIPLGESNDEEDKTEKEMQDEEDKAIEDLKKQGYTDEEAKELIND
jgi:HK97 family phage portal protein